MTNNQRLKNNYKKYQKSKKTQAHGLEFFRALMPEIVFRTTKLEGESVTRRLVRTIFS